MNQIFRPTPITWEDIEGGLGEVVEKQICNFMWEYCYPDGEGYLRSWDSDEELPVGLEFLREVWEKIDGNRDEIATPVQTAAEALGEKAVQKWPSDGPALVLVITIGGKEGKP